MQKTVKMTLNGKTSMKWASGQNIYEFEKEINPRGYSDPFLGLYLLYMTIFIPFPNTISDDQNQVNPEGSSSGSVILFYTLLTSRCSVFLNSIIYYLRFVVAFSFSCITN